MNICENKIPYQCYWYYCTIIFVLFCHFSKLPLPFIIIHSTECSGGLIDKTSIRKTPSSTFSVIPQELNGITCGMHNSEWCSTLWGTSAYVIFQRKEEMALVKNCKKMWWLLWCVERILLYNLIFRKKKKKNLVIIHKLYWNFLRDDLQKFYLK